MRGNSLTLGAGTPIQMTGGGTIRHHGLSANWWCSSQQLVYSTCSPRSILLACRIGAGPGASLFSELPRSTDIIYLDSCCKLGSQSFRVAMVPRISCPCSNRCKATIYDLLCCVNGGLCCTCDFVHEVPFRVPKRSSWL